MDSPISQLFRTESTRPDPLCYLWDAYWTRWESKAVTPATRLVNETNRELTHYLLRYGYNKLRNRVSEANEPTRQPDSGYDITVTQQVEELLLNWIDFKSVRDGFDPVEYLGEYERLFGLSVWQLENRPATRADIRLRSRELIGGESGTFRVIAIANADVNDWANSEWLVQCTCKRVMQRTGRSLIDGTFAPCDALPHIDQLIQNGDLLPDEVAAYTRTEAAIQKIAQREAHLREIAVIHPMVGRRFGDWLVVSYHERVESSRHYHWNCQCKCGTTRSVRQTLLLSGESQSCGACNANKFALAFRTVTGLKPPANPAHSKGTSAGVRETLVSRRVVHCEGIPCDQNGTMHVCLNQPRASEAERNWGKLGRYDSYTQEGPDALKRAYMQSREDENGDES